MGNRKTVRIRCSKNICELPNLITYTIYTVLLRKWSRTLSSLLYVYILSQLIFVTLKSLLIMTILGYNGKETIIQTDKDNVTQVNGEPPKFTEVSNYP